MFAFSNTKTIAHRKVREVQDPARIISLKAMVKVFFGPDTANASILLEFVSFGDSTDWLGDCARLTESKILSSTSGLISRNVFAAYKPENPVKLNEKKSCPDYAAKHTGTNDNQVEASLHSASFSPQE